MTITTKYVHTNIIARDWRALAAFYQQALGCVPIPPERDLSGPSLEAATGVPDARLQGIHLRLPGHGKGGPTLEIFQYDRMVEPTRSAINRLGLAHLAFAVSDVAAARRAILGAGGGEVGQLVSLQVPGSGTVAFVYLTDPEGNILELQHWSR